jgi:Cu/Ag efflux protein CusF
MTVLSLAFPLGLMAQHSHGGGETDPAPSRIYSTDGVIEGIDAGGARFVVSHGPIPQVGWEAMTMGFRVADPSLLEGLAVGDKIRFDIRFQGQQYHVVGVEKY